METVQKLPKQDVSNLENPHQTVLQFYFLKSTDIDNLKKKHWKTFFQDAWKLNNCSYFYTNIESIGQKMWLMTVERGE